LVLTMTHGAVGERASDAGSANTSVRSVLAIETHATAATSAAGTAADQANASAPMAVIRAGRIDRDGTVIIEVPPQ
jgi:hypothetical protein